MSTGVAHATTRDLAEFKRDLQVVFFSNSSTIQVGVSRGEELEINNFGDTDEYFHFRDRRPLRHLIWHKFDVGVVPGGHG